MCKGAHAGRASPALYRAASSIKRYRRLIPIALFRISTCYFSFLLRPLLPDGNHAPPAGVKLSSAQRATSYLRYYRILY